MNGVAGHPSSHIARQLRRLRSRTRIRRGVALAAVSAAVISGATVLTQVPGPAMALAGTGSVNYTCSTPYGAFSLPVDVTGSIPALLSAGQSFTLANYQVQATVPADVVAELEDNGVSSISGTTAIGVNAVNATPGSASQTVTWGPVQLPSPAAAVQISLPASAGTLGPFTASSSYVVLTSANLESLVTLGKTSVSCTAPSPAPVVAQTTGPVIGFGDSVAAGFGLGTADGTGNDNPDAYPAMVAATLGRTYRNFAAFGACATSTDEAHGGGPGCATPGQTPVDQQIQSAPADLMPTLVTLTVGADDIDFEDCFEAELAFISFDPCRPASLSANLSSLGPALTSDIESIAAKYPGVPIRVTDYYNPLPPGPSDPGSTCALMQLATDWLIYDYAGGGYNGVTTLTSAMYQGQFLPFAAQVQAELHAVASRIVGQLNQTISQSVAAAQADGAPAQVVPVNFAGHDMCQAKGTAWVFGPSWAVDLDFLGVHEHDVVAYPYPAPDQPQFDVLVNTGWQSPAGHIYFLATTNALPHPTIEGQRALARAVLKTAQPSSPAARARTPARPLPHSPAQPGPNQPSGPAQPGAAASAGYEMALFSSAAPFTSSSGRHGTVSLSALMNRSPGARAPAALTVSWQPAAQPHASAAHSLTFSLKRPSFSFDPGTQTGRLTSQAGRTSQIEPFGRIDLAFRATRSQTASCPAGGSATLYSGHLRGTMLISTSGSRAGAKAEIPSSTWGSIGSKTRTVSFPGTTYLSIASGCRSRPASTGHLRPICYAGQSWSASGGPASDHWQLSGTGGASTATIAFQRSIRLKAPRDAVAATSDQFTLGAKDTTFKARSKGRGAALTIATSAADGLPAPHSASGSATDSSPASPHVRRSSCMTGLTRTTQTTRTYAGRLRSTRRDRLRVSDDFLPGISVPRPPATLPSTFSDLVFRA